MSKEIDERVVSMGFDNREFERNVSTTLRTLEKLKSSLTMQGATKGLENVNAAARNVDLSSVSRSAETVSMHFSAMEVVAVTALSNITNSAINAGKKILNVIATGGRNRALNIAQAKFQLKGLGVEWKAIEDDINYGVDGTAYGLDSAAKAASQLVASGVQLGDEMKKSLRGISGLAAMTNSSYDEIANIFTTIAGNGRLMGMQLTQISTRGINAAATLGNYLGKTEAQIRDMVSKGKIDFKTFAEAMDSAFGEHAKDANATFTGAMSNVRSALGRIGADFQTPYLDNMINVLNSLRLAINAVKTNLQPLVQLYTVGLEKASAFAVKHIDRITESLNNLATGDSTSKTLASIKETFSKVFNPNSDTNKEINKTRSALSRIGLDFEEIEKSGVAALGKTNSALNRAGLEAQNVEQSAKSIVWLANVLQGAKAAFINIGESLNMIKSAFKEAFLETFASYDDSGLIKISEAFKNLAQHFKMSSETAESLKKIFKGFFSVVKVGTDVAIMFATGILKIATGIPKLSGGLTRIIGSFGEFLTTVAGSINITDSIGKAFDKLGDIASAGIDKVINAGEVLRDILDVIFEYTSKAFSGASSGLGKIFDSDGIDSTLKLLNGGLFAGATVALTRFMNVFTDMARNSKLKISFSTFNNIDKVLMQTRNSLQAWQTTLQAKTLISLGKAVALLAGSLMVISLIDGDKLSRSLAGMSVMMAELVASMVIIQKSVSTNSIAGLTRITISMVAMSSAILILSSALNKISKNSWSEITKGLVGIAGLSAVLVTSANLMEKSSKNLKKAGFGMIEFAAAILILTKSVQDLGALNVEELSKGLISVGIIMSELLAFIKIANFDKIGVTGGLGILAMSSAMLIFAKSVEMLGKIDRDSITQGIIALGSILAELAAFTLLVGNSKSIFGTSTALIAVSASMLIFTQSIKTLGNLDSNIIVKGLVSIAGGLGILSVALFAMSKTKLGAVAMLAASTALAVLTPQLLLLSGMSWEGIAKSLVALAGAFTVIGIAASALSPVILPIMGLGAALALIGTGVAGVGIGLVSIAAGLSSIALLGSAGLSAVSAAIKQIMTDLITFIPSIVGQIGVGVVEFAKAIGLGAPTIGEAIKKLLQSTLDSLKESVPNFVDFVITAITSMLAAVSEHSRDITEKGVEIIAGVLNGMSLKMPDVIDAGFNLVINFINGLADATREHSDEVVDAFANLGDAMIDGLTGALTKGTKKVVDKGRDIGKSVLNKFKEVLGIHSPSKEMNKAGQEVINGLVNALKSDEPEKAAAELGESIKYGVSGIGDTAATAYMKGMSKKEIEAEAVGKMIAMASANGLKYNLSDLKKSGEKAAQAYVDGLNVRYKKEKEDGINGLIDAIKSDSPEKYAEDIFKTIRYGVSGVGETAATKYLEGMSKEEIQAEAIGKIIALAAKNGLELNIDDFKNVGEQAAQAYIDGLNSRYKTQMENFDFSEGWKSERKLAKSGKTLSLNEIATLSDTEAELYWKHGGGEYGKIALEKTYGIDTAVLSERVDRVAKYVAEETKRTNESNSSKSGSNVNITYNQNNTYSGNGNPAQNYKDEKSALSRSKKIAEEVYA